LGGSPNYTRARSAPLARAKQFKAPKTGPFVGGTIAPQGYFPFGWDPQTARLVARKSIDELGVISMEPMKPMTPITGGNSWWPAELGDASASGGQNGIRYAFFRAKHRLLVERDGTLVTYDSGDHVISGIGQQSGQSKDLVFTSQNGTVDLAQRERVG
jgi:hypothetical protein